MSDDAPSGYTVNYTVKELLGRLDVKMDQIISSVADKADQASVEALGVRVGTLETDAAKSMAVAEASRTTARNNRWLIFTAIPTTIAASTAVAALFVR